MTKDRGECNADGVLHEHMYDKELEIIAKRVPKLIGPDSFTKQCIKILQADKDALLIDLGKQRQAQRVEQRVNHNSRVNQHSRGQEYNNVPPEFWFGLMLGHGTVLTLRCDIRIRDTRLALLLQINQAMRFWDRVREWWKILNGLMLPQRPEGSPLGQQYA